jgi:sulfur-oxidizing protein SoxB
MDIPGIDVILTGHTHDALPEPVQVGNTFLIASGSHGKFVSRVDLDVRTARCGAEAPADPDLLGRDRTGSGDDRAGRRDPRALRRGDERGDRHRRVAPVPARQFQRHLGRPVICDALISQRDAQIALSPGFRWGAARLPGQEITREDIYNVTAMTYPNAYRTEMTGEMLHTIFEDVAANIFNPDAYYQQGGDMVRIGGLGYRIDINAGRRAAGSPT